MPVLLAALGALLMSLDSAINIVLPAMADAFSVDAAAIRWVIICYVLTYAFTAFAAGVLADRLGPGPVFTAGLWLCGASPARRHHGRPLLDKALRDQGRQSHHSTEEREERQKRGPDDLVPGARRRADRERGRA